MGEVLVELERRETLQEKIKWDVMLLTGDDTSLVSLDNAYILFKVIVI